MGSRGSGGKRGEYQVMGDERDRKAVSEEKQGIDELREEV